MPLAGPMLLEVHGTNNARGGRAYFNYPKRKNVPVKEALLGLHFLRFAYRGGD